MTVRIAINGFGRIDRSLLRAARGRGLDVVAVNDVADTWTLGHLLAYDSTLGRYPGPVSAADGTLLVDDTKITVFRQADPGRIDWGALGVDIVIEATGRLRTREAAGVHLDRGAHGRCSSRPPARASTSPSCTA